MAWGSSLGPCLAPQGRCCAGGVKRGPVVLAVPTAAWPSLFQPVISSRSASALQPARSVQTMSGSPEIRSFSLGSQVVIAVVRGKRKTPRGRGRCAAMPGCSLCRRSECVEQHFSDEGVTLAFSRSPVLAAPCPLEQPTASPPQGDSGVYFSSSARFVLSAEARFSCVVYGVVPYLLFIYKLQTHSDAHSLQSEDSQLVG